MRTLTHFQDSQLQDLATNPKLRNEVAFAHACHTSPSTGSKYKHHKTCSWPVEYIVTQEQIKYAQELREEQKKSLIERLENSPETIVFHGMGMNFDHNYEKDKENTRYRENIRKSDVQNFRVRAYFMVNDTKYFVEVMTDAEGVGYFDFSIKFTTQADGTEVKEYGYGGLGYGTKIPYTREAILNVINRTFGTKFSEMYVDKYDLNVKDYITKANV